MCDARCGTLIDGRMRKRVVSDEANVAPPLSDVVSIQHGLRPFAPHQRILRPETNREQFDLASTVPHEPTGFESWPRRRLLPTCRLPLQAVLFDGPIVICGNAFRRRRKRANPFPLLPRCASSRASSRIASFLVASPGTGCRRELLVELVRQMPDGKSDLDWLSPFRRPRAVSSLDLASLRNGVV